MNKEQAVGYLRFSGFSDEQIKVIEDAFSCPSAGIDCEDCPAYEDTISRKAVIDTLENMDRALDEDRTVENYKDLLRECYKVLPSKSEWDHDHEILKAYSDGASAVLDEVRAEIEERKLNSGGEPNRELAFNVCLQIIDKYAEEDKA